MGESPLNVKTLIENPFNDDSVPAEKVASVRQAFSLRDVVGELNDIELKEFNRLTAGGDGPGAVGFLLGVREARLRTKQQKFAAEGARIQSRSLFDISGEGQKTVSRPGAVKEKSLIDRINSGEFSTR